MILGLDISTSIIGVTVLDKDGKIIKTDALDLRNKNTTQTFTRNMKKSLNTSEVLGTNLGMIMTINLLMFLLNKVSKCSALGFHQLRLYLPCLRSTVL